MGRASFVYSLFSFVDSFAPARRATWPGRLASRWARLNKKSLSVHKSGGGRWPRYLAPAAAASPVIHSSWVPITRSRWSVRAEETGLAPHNDSRVAGSALVINPDKALAAKRSGGGGRVCVWSWRASRANMCPNAQEAFHLLKTLGNLSAKVNSQFLKKIPRGPGGERRRLKTTQNGRAMVECRPATAQLP